MTASAHYQSQSGSPSRRWPVPPWPRGLGTRPAGRLPAARRPATRLGPCRPAGPGGSRTAGTVACRCDGAWFSNILEIQMIPEQFEMWAYSTERRLNTGTKGVFRFQAVIFTSCDNENAAGRVTEQTRGQAPHGKPGCSSTAAPEPPLPSPLVALGPLPTTNKWGEINLGLFSG